MYNMFIQILRPSNSCCWISVPTYALNSRLILFYSVAFFLYEKCLYRDASCAKRWHLILPLNQHLCLGLESAALDSLSNGNGLIMLLLFNQAMAIVFHHEVEIWLDFGLMSYKQALDTLGNTKWRVNRRLLDVVERIWTSGGNIAGLVDREDVRRTWTFSATISCE